MSRLFLLLIVAAAAGIAGVLFPVKYRVQDLERELAGLNAQILEDREAMHVLKTEWSYLNQPERIAELAQRHLAMGVMEPLQVVSFDVLPPRPEDFGYAQADLEKELPQPRLRPGKPSEGPAELQVASLPAKTAKALPPRAAQPVEPEQHRPAEPPLDDIGEVIARLIGEAPVGLDPAPQGSALPISASGGVIQ